MARRTKPVSPFVSPPQKGYQVEYDNGNYYVLHWGKCIAHFWNGHFAHQYVSTFVEE